MKNPFEKLLKKKAPPQEHALSPKQAEGIDSLEESIGKIFERLHHPISKGEYRLILGEDASGRVPMWIVSKALREIYTARGYDSPAVRYVAGSRQLFSEHEREQKRDMLKKYLSGLKKELILGSEKPKVLIVTDAIYSGRGMKVLLSALEASDLRADVATISLPQGNYAQRELEGNFDTSVIAASEKETAIFGDRDISGVFKRAPELHSHAVQAYDQEFFGEPKAASPEMIEARKKGSEIAHRLAEKFLSQ